MSKNRMSKKDLRNLLSETIDKAVGTLKLPKPDKKVKKIIDSQSKKLASAYSDIMKSDEKKQKKADKKLQKALLDGEKKSKNAKGKDKDKDKGKERKNQNGKLVEPITI